MALSMINKYKQPGYSITTGAPSAPMSTPRILFQGKELKVGDTWTSGGQQYEMTPQGSRVVQQQASPYANNFQPPQPAAVANQNLSSLYADTLNELRAAQERQYAATKARDEELRKGYEERKVESMKMLEGMGAQERADIESSWAGKASQAKQDMLSRGLMGTTVSPTVLAGYQRGAKEDVGRLEERLRQQKLGTYGQLTADQLGQIERVSDIPPDTGRYMQLMQQLGQAQAMAEPQGQYATPVQQSGKSVTTTSYTPGYLQWKQELAAKNAAKKTQPNNTGNVKFIGVNSRAISNASAKKSMEAAAARREKAEENRKKIAGKNAKKGVQQGYMVGNQGLVGTPPKKTGDKELDAFNQQEYNKAVKANMNKIGGMYNTWSNPFLNSIYSGIPYRQ